MRSIADGFTGPLTMALVATMALGSLYWIWVAVKLGSFAMFVIGVLGPSVIITAPIGAYMMFFGIPNWIHSLFG